jgi:hypothetical protein
MDMTQGMKRSGRERLGGSTRGARGQESHEGEMIVLGERAKPGGKRPQAGQPRPAGLAYKWCPRHPSSAGK